MFADPEVMAKWNEHQELQQTFKETHKTTDRLKGATLQPTELKREVQQLEELLHVLLATSVGCRKQHPTEPMRRSHRR